MNWVVIVPLKPEGSRKTRLKAILPDAERARLGAAWFAHVVETLSRIDDLRVIVLSDRPPPRWGGEWRRDEGRGLNAELQAARSDLGVGPLAILHADLPCLQSSDVEALLAAAERSGYAIAPDRHRTGTNALAIADGRAVRFAFGPMSFRRHFSEAGDASEVVEREGLGLDIDTPDDFREAANRARSPD